MTNFYIALSLFSVFTIGFIRLRNLLFSIRDKISFIYDYRNKFIDLANLDSHVGNFYAPRNFNPDLHHWLTLNSIKAQNAIGGFGIGQYVAPYQLYKMHNYEFIIGTVSKFTEGSLHRKEINIVDNILVRSIGHYEEIEKRLKKDSGNPIKWFQYGIQLIISIPIYLLNWFGIISDNRLNDITSNLFFRIISGLIGFISFFGSVVTIFTGWKDFVKILTSYFN